MQSSLTALLIIIVFSVLALSDEDAEKTKLDKRISSIETSLLERARIKDQPIATFSIDERMRRYRVPGVSITVINDYQIEWSKSYGVMNVSTGALLDKHTRFQAGSLSKPLTALALLRLAKDNGIRLSEEANRYLKTWRIPHNVYTARNPVTLQQLLDHTSGIQLPWTPGYKPDSPIPELFQILVGEPPARTPPVKVVNYPGREWSYSNGGYMVVQQLIEDISGKRFEDIVAAEVLYPLGMYDSGFAQPPIGLDALNTAVSHTGQGEPLPGSWHVYPEKAAAGLWSTSADLARFLVALMQAWNDIDGASIEQDIARAMIGTRSKYGLGIWTLGSDNDPHICHTGTNFGFKSAIHAFPARGQGVVVMTNGELGETLVNEIVRSVAAEYGWPDFEQETIEASPLSNKEMRHFVGTYVFREDDYYTYIIYRNETLRFAGETDPASRLYHAKDNEFFILDKDWRFTFVTDTSGRIESLIIDTANRKIKCIPADTQQMAIR